MKSDSLRAIALVAGAVIVLASGIWLTRVGRPYGTALLNVHKLVDLAVVVVVALGVYQANRAVPLAAGEWAVLAATGVLVVATFASGGATSAMKAPAATVLWLHRIGSWLAAGLLAVIAYVAATR